MNQAIVDAIKKTALKVETGNKKSSARSRHQMRKWAEKNPEEYKEAVSAEPEAALCTHTMKYGCLGRIVDVGTKTDINVDMRSGHEYYNMLVEAVLPQVEEYIKLYEGPVRRRMNKICDDITAAYREIGIINQSKHSKQVKSDPQVVENQIKKLENEIKTLKESQYDLVPELRTEIKERGALPEIKALEKSLKVNKETRNIRPENLWYGNYKREEDSFEQAINTLKTNVKNATFFKKPKLNFRYARRDGSRQSVLDLPSWNHEGRLSFYNDHKVKTIATIMAGTNPRLRFHRLQQEELSTFGLPDNFLKCSGSEKLYVVSITNGGSPKAKQWRECVVKLHRPLSENPNDLVKGGSFSTKKVGLKHKTYLTVTVTHVNPKKPMGTGTAFIKPTWELLPDGLIKCCEWQIGDEKGFEILPPIIKSGLDTAERINKYIADHTLRAIELLKELGQGNPDAALPLGLRGSNRSALRHSYKSWCRLLCPKDSSEDKKKKFKQTIKEMRAMIRERHGKFFDGVHTMGGAYGKDYEFALALLTDKAMSMNLEKKQAEAFSAILMFDERYSHLYEFSVNLRNKCFSRRTDIYRNIASKLGKRVTEFIVPGTDYRTRKISKLQVYVSPSGIQHWLKNYARREGLKFTELAPEKEVKTAKAGV